MVPKAGLPDEALPAPRAPERPLSGVDPLVLGEEGAVTEGLPAPLAPEGLLAAVDAWPHCPQVCGFWPACALQRCARCERWLNARPHSRTRAASRRCAWPGVSQAREVLEALGSRFARVGSLPFHVSLTGPGARAAEKFGSSFTAFLGTFCFGDGPVGSVWLSLLEKEVLKAP